MAKVLALHSVCGLLLLCDASVLGGVSTMNVLLAGNGSYIVWPSVALTLGYDIPFCSSILSQALGLVYCKIIVIICLSVQSP